MSLPKPDIHVRLDDDAAYWLRTLSAIEQRPQADIAREILVAELSKRADRMTAVAQRLLADGRVRVQRPGGDR